jgi:hypothetical protein
MVRTPIVRTTNAESILTRRKSETRTFQRINAMPERIQRKRVKGWKMPPNTVYVGRPTKWGNPFIVGRAGGAYTAKVRDQRHAWQLFRSVAIDNEKLIAAAQAELRGKNLACFCPLPTQPYEPDCCHAAVLLELANAEIPFQEIHHATKERP